MHIQYTQMFILYNTGPALRCCLFYKLLLDQVEVQTSDCPLKACPFHAEHLVLSFFAILPRAGLSSLWIPCHPGEQAGSSIQGLRGG